MTEHRSVKKRAARTKAKPRIRVLRLTDEGGETFLHVAPSVAAARRCYKRIYGPLWNAGELPKIVSVYEFPDDEEITISGDVEPSDVPPGGRWDHVRKVAIGTATQWAAYAGNSRKAVEIGSSQF